MIFVEPETADNIDAGFRYSTLGFNSRLTYYNINFVNRITFVSNEDVNGIDFLEAAAGGFVNDGGVESDGIEASVDYRLTDNLGVYVSYTKNDSTYTDDAFLGKTVIGIPQDISLFSIDSSQGDFYARFSTKYVGERFLAQAQPHDTDSYALMDFYVRIPAYNIG